MIRRLSVLPIAALCALSFLAARQTLSDMYAHTAALEIEAWSRPGFRREADALPQAIAKLERALTISPNNAWALELMGAMRFEAVRNATDPQEAVAAARASRDSFRRALWQRPTAAQTWVNVALAKQSLGELDGEYFAALEQSVRYGPWEPAVLLLGLQTGLGAWDQTSPAQRELILGMRDRAAQRDAASVNRIARDYNRPDLACDPKAAKSADGKQPCPRPSS
jgi:tetratricopeptide (TPR) repeat protein